MRPPNPDRPDTTQPPSVMLKTMRVFLALAVLFVAVYFLLGRHRSEPFEVELSATAQRQGERLSVRGDTNLPDGAILLYTLFYPPSDAPADRGRLEIEEGHFEAHIDVQQASPEQAMTLELRFQVVMDDGSQPPELIERFGAFGETLTGELVSDGELGKRAVLLVPVDQQD